MRDTCRQRAGAKSHLHRLGRALGDRRRSFLLGRSAHRHRGEQRLDPGCGHGSGAIESGPGRDQRQRATAQRDKQQGPDCRRAAPAREPGGARRAHQCAAHRRRPSPARRPAVLDACRLQQRPLPVAAADHDDTGLEYLLGATSPGSEVNAVGIYAWYHIAALQQAQPARPEQLTPERAPRWRGRCSPTKASRCTSSNTYTPPATSPGPGATCRSARARTTTTTRPASRPSPGTAAATRRC